MVAKAYICHKTTRLAGACTNLDTIVNNSHVRNTLLEIVVPRDSARLGSTWLGLAWRFAREHAGISRGRLDPRRGIKNRHNGPLCVCLFARRFGDGVVRRCVGMSSLWNEFHRRFSGSAQCVICCGLRKRPPSKKWTALQGWPARARRSSCVDSLRSAKRRDISWLRMPRIDVLYNTVKSISSTREYYCFTTPGVIFILLPGKCISQRALLHAFLRKMMI